MLTHEQYKKKALAEISTYRQRSFAKLDVKLAKLYKKHPELIQMEAQRKELMEKVAEEVSQNASLDTTTARHITSMQKIINERYRALGLSPEDLEPDFRCPVCKDSSRHEGKLCSCVARQINEFMQKDLAAITPLELSHFSTFDLALYPEETIPSLGKTARDQMRDVLAYCKEFADYYSPDNRSILMIGNAGLGKTHLALAIANEVINRGYLVVYVSAGNIFSELDRFRREGDNRLLQLLYSADLLILDDLGSELVTPSTLNYLYNILNERLNSSRCSVYTTNITTQDMLMARYTEKIASRLLGSCDQLHFAGEDIRLQQNL